MEIIGNDGNRLKGNWTGGVKTKVRNAYITAVSYTHLVDGMYFHSIPYLHQRFGDVAFPGSDACPYLA